MPAPTQTLPAGYQPTHVINLAHDRKLAIGLNLAATAVFVASLVALATLARWLRPEQLSGTFTVRLDLATLAPVLAVLGLVVASVVVHELIHGVCFWRVTGQRPAFAVRLTYAFAAAPAWFIPFRPYTIIGLAPLVALDALGLLLMAFGPASWLGPLIFLVALNTGGAVGDLWIITWLWRSPRDCLVQDSGDTVRYFAPGPRPAG